MTALAEAEAALEAARDRGDTRSIGAAQKAVRSAMTAELRAGVAAERKRRADEAEAEAERERRQMPFWARIIGRRH